MVFNRKQSEEESINNKGSQPNTSSLDDELADILALERDGGEMMVIRTLQRHLGPIFVPLLRPIICQLVDERMGLAKQEPLATVKENPANEASTSVLKKLKLQFRNRIALPVFTGTRLLAENQKHIEIALVDALTEQIVNTGIESTAKLKIIGFRVGDDDSWTCEEFQERIMSERKGKQILQGNTFVQLKEGIGFIHSKISFTHNSDHTRNGLYRLGAIVVDATLVNGVEVAWTETFVMKDHRSTYYEKHPYPSLSDKVCHLQKISYKGKRFKHMKDEGVMTVKDLLTLLYTDQKRLENVILKVKAGSKIWNEIVKNAQASNGMFLYLDPRKERKTGVVLNAKLRLTALIVEPHQYIPFNHLSDKQKVDSQKLVRVASEHFEMLDTFEDETFIKAYLQSVNGFTSSNQTLGTCNITHEPTTTYSQIIYSSSGLTELTKSMNDSNFHMGQSTDLTSIVTSQSGRGKEKAPTEDKTVYSKNYFQQYISSHPPNLRGVNELNLGTVTAHNVTEPGTSLQAAEPLSDMCGIMNTCEYDIFRQSSEGLEELQPFINYDDCYNIPLVGLNYEWHANEANYDASVVAQAAQTVSVAIGGENSVNERISRSQGIQGHKKQRRC